MQSLYNSIELLMETKKKDNILIKFLNIIINNLL